MNRSSPIAKLILLLFLPVAATGQERGFDILTIGPNTHALGMNETVTATLLGATNMYANPANLAFESASSLSADYSLWIADLTNSHVSANFKSGTDAFALGLLTSSTDNLELRDRPGPSQGEFSITYFSAAAAYAKKVGNFSIGATAQFLREEILVYEASGYAFNLGISSRWLNNKLYIASTIRNWGDMEKLNQETTALPTEWRTGAYATLFAFEAGNQRWPIELSMATDVVYPIGFDTNNSLTNTNSTDAYLTFSFVSEIANTLRLYSGYRTDDSERPISMGTSVMLETVNIHYALIPFSTGFGSAHSIGISYYF